jgi:hypothetical protein
VHLQVGGFAPDDERLDPAWEVLAAHLADLADLAEAHDGVHLDTTMAGTDFTNRLTPMPADYPGRLAGLRDKVVLGSDFPAVPYPYAHQLQALARLGLGDDWLRAVLWTNGARLLGLPAGGSVSRPPSGSRPGPWPA